MSDTFSEPRFQTGISADAEIVYGNNSPLERLTARGLDAEVLQSRNMRILLQQNPSLASNPQALLQLANTSDPITLSTSGASAFGQLEAYDHAQVLQSKPVPEQRGVWDTYSSLQQQALLAVGYMPPETDENGNWFTNSLDLGGKILGTALGGVSTAIGWIPGGSNALNFLTFVADQPMRLYRTIRTMEGAGTYALAGAALGVGAALAPFTGGTSLAAGGALSSSLAAGIIGGAALAGGTAGAFISNPTDWRRAFGDARDGERVFLRNAQLKAQNILEDDRLVNLAADIAFELSPYELAFEIAGVRNGDDPRTWQSSLERVAAQMADPDSPEFNQVIQGMTKLLSEPKFVEAVQTLQDGKISIGRDVARTMQLNPDSTLYKIASGSVDAFTQFALDPFLLAAPMVRYGRFAGRSLIERPNPLALMSHRTGNGFALTDNMVERRIHISNKNRAVRAMDEQIVRAVATNNFDLMPKNMRAVFEPFRRFLQNEGILDNNFAPKRAVDRQDLMDWFKTEDARMSLMRGDGMVPGISAVPVIKPISDRRGMGIVYAAARSVRGSLSEARTMTRIDEYLRTTGKNLNELRPATTPETQIHKGLVTTRSFAPEIEVAGDEAIAVVPNRVGATLSRLLDAISNMAPRSNQLHLIGPEAVRDVPAFVNVLGMMAEMPEWMRREWIDAIMGQEGSGARVQLIRSFYNTVFDITGMKNTAKGRKLIADFSKQANKYYAVASMDELYSATTSTTRGVFLSHAADALEVPDPREMIEAMRLDNVIAHTLPIAPVGQALDIASNKIWKPSVIFRIGFIPRAIGEEALAYAARGAAGGGLGQMMAANRLVKYDMFRAIQAKQLRGDILSEAEQKLLTYKYPAIVRPLAKALDRLPIASDYEASFLAKLETFYRKVFDPSVVKEQKWRTGWSEILDSNNLLVRSLIGGRPHSWRRTLAGGVQDKMLYDTRKMMYQHADTIMEHNSSGNASTYDDMSIDQADVIRRREEEPGVIREDRYQTRRRRIYDRSNDPEYLHALHDYGSEPLRDAVMGPAIAATYPLLPSSKTRVALDIFQDNLLDGEFIELRLLDGFDALTPSQQSLLFNLLKPVDDRMAAFVDSINFAVPSMADEFSMIRDIPNRQDALLQMFRSLQNGKLSTRTYSDAQRESIILLFEFIDQMSMASHADDTLNWLHMYLSATRNAEVRKLVEQYGLFGDITEMRMVAAELALTELRKPENLARANDMERISQNRFGEHVVNRQSPTQIRLYPVRLTNPENVINKLERILDIYGESASAMALDQGVESVIEYFTAFGVRTLSENLLDSADQRFVRATTTPTLNEETFQNLLEAVVEEYVRDRLTTIMSPLGVPPMTNPPESLINRRLQRYYDSPTIAVEDPRYMVLLNEVFNERGSHATVRDLQYVDIARERVANKANYDGTFELNTGVYQLGSRHAGETNTIAGRMLDDGFGVPLEEALIDFVDLGLDVALSTHRKKVNKRYLINAENPYGTIYRKRVSKNPDQQLVPLGRDYIEPREIVYTEAGVPIDFENEPNFFQPIMEAEDPNDLWYQFVAPMVSDYWDEQLGTIQLVPKRVISYDKNGAQIESIETANAQWSRIEDINLNDAPSETIGFEYETDFNGVWDRILQYGFDSVITPAIDGGIRHPMSLALFIESKDVGLKLYETVFPAVNLAKGSQISPDVYQTFIRSGLQPNVAESLAIWEYFDNAIMLTAREAGMTSRQYLRQMKFDDAPAFIKVRSFEEWDDFKRSMDLVAGWLETVEEQASIRAISMLEPFLDTSKNRSIFSVYTKNLMPFWYAEENFIKRWARGAYASGMFGIDQLRRGQLMMNGLRSAGIIQTDDNGTEWVVYPGSGLLTEAISKLAPNASVFDTGVLFKSQTTALLPGFNAEAGRPSFGPVAALPVRMLRNIFPELNSFERSLLGDIGASQSVYGMIAPASARRFVDVIFADPDSSAKVNAAMGAVIAMDEAQGRGLPGDASPTEKQAYLDRVRQHARIVLFTQALLGFVTPGAPTATLTGGQRGLTNFSWLTGIGVDDPAKAFNKDYLFYIKTHGYEEGVEKFLTDNPFATAFDILNPQAFTVSRSETLTGKGIPATQVAFDYYRDNQQWVNELPYAAAWLVPPAESTEEFDLYIYGQMFEFGYRKALAPEEILDQHVFRRAGAVYFPKQKEFDARMEAAANNETLLARVRTEKEQWNAAFFAAEPLFESMLMTGEPTLRRENTIRELRAALDDPRTPPSPFLDSIRTLLNMYDLHVGRMNLYAASGNSNRIQTARRDERQLFTMAGDEWALKNPQLSGLWTTIIQPEMM